MCCFTRPVKTVNSTRVFAREGQGASQFVVYQMNLEAKEDLAMVLPLPTDRSKGEAALEFINLEDYPVFFSDLESGFAKWLALSASAGTRSMSKGEPKLKVFEVGSFEASFVPTGEDFSRLDERFRFPKGVWDQLPEHRRFGFAVFKLKSGARKYHPMALSFQRSDSSRLFFPTIHIHDGKFHLQAKFDHVLYCQPGRSPLDVMGWEESRTQAGQFTNVEKTKGIIDANEHCYKKELTGKLANRDTLVEKIG
jgi:hypothetical protein